MTTPYAPVKHQFIRRLRKTDLHIALNANYSHILLDKPGDI